MGSMSHLFGLLLLLRTIVAYILISEDTTQACQGAFYYNSYTYYLTQNYGGYESYTPGPDYYGTSTDQCAVYCAENPITSCTYFGWYSGSCYLFYNMPTCTLVGSFVYTSYPMWIYYSPPPTTSPTLSLTWLGTRSPTTSPTRFDFPFTTVNVADLTQAPTLAPGATLSPVFVYQPLTGSLAPTYYGQTPPPSLAPTGGPTQLPPRGGLYFLPFANPQTTWTLQGYNTGSDTKGFQAFICEHAIDGYDSTAYISFLNGNPFIEVPGYTAVNFTFVISLPPNYMALRSQDPALSVLSCVKFIVTRDILNANVTQEGSYYKFLTVTVPLQCDAGYYSATGNNYPYACQPCPLGTYSNSVGVTSCNPCSESLPLTADVASQSSGDCIQCPLGSYCPIGSEPLPCPYSGGYEPTGAQLRDRNASDCVSVPCQINYYCGPGAAEGGSYQQVLEFQASYSTTVQVKQQKKLAVNILNTQPVNVYINLKPIVSTFTSPTSYPSVYSTDGTDTNGETNPSNDYAVVFNPYNDAGPNGPYEQGSWLALFPSATTPLYFGLDANYIGQNVNVTFTLQWSYDSVAVSTGSDPSKVFYTTVSIYASVVTIVVSPTSFQYVLTLPVNAHSAALSPLPSIDIYNTLCNNDLSFYFQSSCFNQSLPSWLYFDKVNPTTTPQTVEQQRGIPLSTTFALNYSDPVFNASILPLSNVPAATYSTCFQIMITLIGLDYTIEEDVNITLQILRPCAPGYYSSTGTDANGCLPCLTGYYQASSGQTVCTACPQLLPKTLSNAATALSDCVADAGNLLYNGTQLSCNSLIGANCSQVGLTIQTLPVIAGYWRASPLSTKILSCPDPIYCQGGSFVSVVNSNSSSSGRRRQLDSSNPENLSSDGMCLPFHTGAFCYGCDPGYVKRSELHICYLCSPSDYQLDKARMTGTFFGFSVALVFVGFLIFFLTNRTHNINSGRSSRSLIEKKVYRLTTTFDMTVTITICTGYLQVVGGMSSAFRDVLPAFFLQLRQVFYVLALDFVNVLDFGCTLAQQNHYTSLVITTLLPISVSLALLFVHVILTHTHARNDDVLRAELKNTTFTCFLVILFLCYPSVSNKVFATFNCRSIDNGESVLYIDPSLSCQNSLYTSYLVYAVFMLFVYPIGIPCFYSYFLYKERNELNPFTKDTVILSKVAAAVREKNARIRYLKFLWRPYKPKFYWFEVFELLRKLSQTSIVVFVQPGTSGQMIFQLAITILAVVILNALTPYQKLPDNLLAIFAQWVILGIVLITLLIRLNNLGLSGDTTYDLNALDALLVTLFFSVFAFAIVEVIWRTLVHRGGIKVIAASCCKWGDNIDEDEENNFKEDLERQEEKDQVLHTRRKTLVQPDVVKPVNLAESEALIRKMRTSFVLVERELEDRYEKEKAQSHVLQEELENRNEELKALESELTTMAVDMENAKAKAQQLEHQLRNAVHDEDNEPSRRTSFLPMFAGGRKKSQLAPTNTAPTPPQPGSSSPPKKGSLVMVRETQAIVGHENRIAQSFDFENKE